MTNFIEHAVIYVLIILQILLALSIMAVVWPLQWIAYPVRCGIANYFGDPRPQMPIYPPECACILG